MVTVVVNNIWIDHATLGRPGFTLDKMIRIPNVLCKIEERSVTNRLRANIIPLVEKKQSTNSRRRIVGSVVLQKKRNAL